MSFLVGFVAWVGEIVMAVIYLAIVLTMVCAPMVLLYAAVHILVTLVARLLGRRRPASPAE